MNLFPESAKSTFPYWWAHVCACNMVAANLRVWEPRYLFHDWEKPWMLLGVKILQKLGFLRKGDPYEWVQTWHRKHRKHHVAYYIAPGFSHDGRMPNIREMVIDWEASRFSKQSSPLTAYEYFVANLNKIPVGLHCPIECELKKLNLWPTDETGAYEHIKY